MEWNYWDGISETQWNRRNCRDAMHCVSTIASIPFTFENYYFRSIKILNKCPGFATNTG